MARFEIDWDILGVLRLPRIGKLQMRLGVLREVMLFICNSRDISGRGHLASSSATGLLGDRLLDKRLSARALENLVFLFRCILGMDGPTGGK